jgi:hypothetical protein
MPGVTNRGKYALIEVFFRAGSVPTNLFAILFTSAAAPTADTNLVSDLTEIAAGNGYTTGGISLARNATDFDVLTEDDANDRALVQAKDVVWTASGGSLPGSGSGARYAGITTDEGTVANRRIVTYFDLVSDRTVSSGQTLTLQNLEVRLTET